jgi:hypothetical protein
MDAFSTLITLSREDARALFARGEPGGNWTILMSLLERCEGQAGRHLDLGPSWDSLQQRLEERAREDNLAAALQLLSGGQPLPGLDQGGQATMMRPDLVPHAASEFAGLLQLWPREEDADWHVVQSIATLLEQAARDGCCVVFISGV